MFTNSRQSRYSIFMKEAISKDTQKSKTWLKVYTAIKQDIINSRYKPGDLLPEMQIANELGVSRTPVTMALNLLEQENVITNTNGKKHIAKLTVSEVRNLFDVKISLQSSLCRFAVQRKEPEHDAEMSIILSQMNDFLNNPFDDDGVNDVLVKDWIPIDNNFHCLVATMAKSPMVTKILEDCDMKWHALRFNIIALGDRTKKNVIDHINIGNSIINNEEDAAARIMQEHLEKLRDSAIHVMSIFN